MNEAYGIISGTDEGEAWDNIEFAPIVVDNFDRIGWEKMFHNMPQEQMEVLICLYLGFKPVEIVKVLKYPNIVKYYNISAKMRKLYNEQKNHFVDYNEV